MTAPRSPEGTRRYAAWPYHAALVFAFGLLVRLWLIHRYPIIFGGDTILRLMAPEKIVVAHNLPALQAAIHVLSRLSPDPLLVRYFMAVVGAVAGVGFYQMARALMPQRAAYDAALLFVAHPFILPRSTVPYQEILMLAGLLFAFHFTFRERWYLASLALGAACLTRHEAWVACPVLAGAYIWRHGVHPATLLRGGALYGWAPLGWTAYNAGFAPSGHFTVDIDLSLERFTRWLYVGWVAVRNTPLPALPIAGLGLWAVFKRDRFRSRPYQLLMAFLALFFIALLFSAHGVTDQPERFVTPREAHVPLVGMLVLIGLGLVEIPRMRAALVAVTVLTGLWMADRFVMRETSQPGYALSYRVAQYLDRHVTPREEVVVLARPFDTADLNPYLDKLQQVGGDEARRAGLENLQRGEAAPLGYQRILVYSRLGKDQLKSHSVVRVREAASGGGWVEVPAWRAERHAPTPHWIVMWSDFTPTNPVEAELAALVRDQAPRREFGQLSTGVGVYALAGSRGAR